MNKNTCNRNHQLAFASAILYCLQTTQTKLKKLNWSFKVKKKIHDL